MITWQLLLLDILSGNYLFFLLLFFDHHVSRWIIHAVILPFITTYLLRSQLSWVRCSGVTHQEEDPGSTQDRHLTVPPDKFGWEREVWASALHLLPKDLTLDKWRWIIWLLSACSWQWGLFQTVTVNWVSLFHISCRLIAPPDSSDWIRLAAPQKHKVWLSGWWGFFTGDKHVSRKDQKSDVELSCLQCFIFAVETWSVFLDSQTRLF